MRGVSPYVSIQIRCSLEESVHTCRLISESVINLCGLLKKAVAAHLLELVKPGLTKPPLLSLARRSNNQLNQDGLMRLCPTWLSHLSWMSLFYF